MAFRSIAHQSVKVGRTRELVLAQLTVLGDHPVLVVEHLGETNTDFWNDAIARANADQAGRRKRSKLTPQQIVVARGKNRDLLVQHCVRDTKGFFHDGPDGRPDPRKPAARADVEDIVRSLPDDVVDDVMIWVTEANNFRDEEIAGDPKVLAGE